MFDFKFERSKQEGTILIVDVNYKDRKGRFIIMDDGKLEYLDSDSAQDFHSDFKFSVPHLNDYVTTAYHNILKLRKTKRVIKDKSVAPSHWWYTLSVDKKIELIMRVEEKTEDFVNQQILISPQSKLNSYYLSLIERVKYSKLTIIELHPKDIAKLPIYDTVTDRLYGKPSQFLKLLAVTHPSGRRGDRYASFV